MRAMMEQVKARRSQRRSSREMKDRAVRKVMTLPRPDR